MDKKIKTYTQKTVAKLTIELMEEMKDRLLKDIQEIDETIEAIKKLMK